jgi:rod shape-determining protein MreC
MGGLLPPAERRSSAVLGAYVALSLLLLLTGERIPTDALRGIGAWLFAPLDRIVLTADRMVAGWRENQKLHERVATLEIENLRLRVAGVENQVLRAQMELPPWHTQPLKPVEILALAGEPIPTAAVLSAGRRQGVNVGDAVLTRDGLLGRVGEVYPNLSRAVLLMDPNSALACEVESTSVLGVLHSFASPRPRLLLTGVPLADTVLIGQRVLTSGLSRRFPRGIPVGVVKSVGPDPSGLTHEIEVAQSAQLSRARYGFVMGGQPAVVGLP